MSDEKLVISSSDQKMIAIAGGIIIGVIPFLFVFGSTILYKVTDTQKRIGKLEPIIYQIEAKVSLPTCEEVEKAKGETDRKEQEFCQQIQQCLRVNCKTARVDRERCIKALNTGEDEWVARCRSDCAFTQLGCPRNFHSQQSALLECFKQ
ncbi:MAG TPA: hypothetical protein DEB09_06030 [Candidatus Magasanikbacteria bacterium]|nr:hypothetical protein [Candidatus Magasanikbacteria bacterium]